MHKVPVGRADGQSRFVMTRATVAWRLASSEIPRLNYRTVWHRPQANERFGRAYQHPLLDGTGFFTGRLIARMAIVHPTGRSGAGQDLVSRVLTSVTLGWCGVMAYTISLGGRLLPGQGHHRT